MSPFKTQAMLLYGDAIFRRDCTACHDGPTFSGALAAASAIMRTQRYAIALRA